LTRHVAVFVFAAMDRPGAGKLRVRSQTLIARNGSETMSAPTLCSPQVAQVMSERQGRNILE
jgi:hypothetical protein